jgi:hypothetical protein
LIIETFTCGKTEQEEFSKVDDILPLQRYSRSRVSDDLTVKPHEVVRVDDSICTLAGDVINELGERLLCFLLLLVLI